MMQLSNGISFDNLINEDQITFKQNDQKPKIHSLNEIELKKITNSIKQEKKNGNTNPIKG